MDRRGPVRFRERPPLIVRNRHEGGSRKFSYNVIQSWQVEPPVHSGEKRHAEATEERKWQPVDVSVNYVKIFRPLRDSLEQYGTGGVRIRPLSAQTERAGPHRMKLAACLGIAARKKRDLMAERDQLVNQPRDHPLGAAI